MSASASVLGRSEAENATDAVLAAPGRPVPAPEEALRFVAAALAEHRGQAETLLIHLPAPLAEPEALLLAAGTDHGVLWASPAGRGFAGSGRARTIALAGPGRPAALRRQAERLFAGIQAVAHPLAQSPAPRLFGGFAFQAGSAGDGPWRGYGDGSFTLPRWLYSRDGDDATLSLALPREETAPDALILDRLGEVLAALAGPLPQPPDPALAIGFDALSRPEWERQVEDIRRAIRSGTVSKIVAARRSTVEFDGPLDPLAVLHRLRPEQRQGCLRFAFWRPGTTFLGATPEHLVARRGGRIESEALAGSIGSGESQADRLLASRKDLFEHALVVEHIVERLRPLCDGLEWSPQPRIRELRNLLHLHTPIRGRLHGDTHVLELVAALHPTPAVAGVPAAAAVRWITGRESAPRGWYAGPVGWFDATGDGDFDVALRSCLLAGSRGWLYAGAGIMGDSDPELEYQETDLKQRSLLAALGVGE